MNFFQKIDVVWRSISIVQRALLISICLTFIIVGGLLIHWARQPDMGVLYSSLDPEEAAKITEKISERGIVYKLTSGGTTIYAPKENIAQLRLDMAKEGLPEGGQKGYGIFDDEKIGISPFVQNVNLKRALQDELARSIQMIDGISHARVHIVSTSQTIFTSVNSQTSASVVLRLKPGYRTSALNIAAITHLVAGSVEGLKSENITVVDSQGRLLSNESDQIMAGGAGTVADYRERVEQSLSNKVEDMLTAVLGPGRATVRVSAEIDMTSTNIAKESYDESKKVTKREEIESNSETKGGKTSEKGQATTSPSTKKAETIVTEYAVPKTIQQIVELAGKIKSLAVAAVVDLEVDVEAGQEGEQTETTAQATKIMKKEEVEKLITNALGLKVDNGDTLEVVEARFHRPMEVLIGTEEAGGLDYIAIARHGSLGIMAICALFVLKMVGGAKKKATLVSEAEQSSVAGEISAGEESLVLRKQIANSLRSNPKQAKQLFSSWLDEKGS
ncbi:MAG: flagellar basal-body MS-ring/collar protein FliF [Planctomycetota bacterium]|jgi:flagellar M-ring protein FliF